jgi:hypothetical protein
MVSYFQLFYCVSMSILIQYLCWSQRDYFCNVIISLKKYKIFYIELIKPENI